MILTNKKQSLRSSIYAGYFYFFAILNSIQFIFAMIKEKIQKEIHNLSKKERAELAHLLIKSLEADQEFDSKEAWSKELKKRVDRHAAGESELTSWNTVSKKVRKIIEE